jgi:hypothetical protein
LGYGEGEVSSHVQLDTDMAAAELLDYYAKEVLQPDWQVIHRRADADLTTLSWTFHDDGGHAWFGALVVADGGSGITMVRMWMVSDVGASLSAIAP